MSFQEAQVEYQMESPSNHYLNKHLAQATEVGRELPETQISIRHQEVEEVVVIVVQEELEGQEAQEEQQ